MSVKKRHSESDMFVFVFLLSLHTNKEKITLSDIFVSVGSFGFNNDGHFSMTVHDVQYPEPGTVQNLLFGILSPEEYNIYEE